MGKEIIEWFNKEYNKDENAFKEKLDLEFGTVEENYEFGKKKVKQEITIENSQLVDKTYTLYQAT